VLELAKKHGFACIEIAGGNPPRSQFGYSVVEQLFLLNHFGLVKDSLIHELATIPAFLRQLQDSIVAKAEELAVPLLSKIPVIYAEARMEGLAVRWRQQINENAKRLCWHHVFPEMNHNELVGWEGADDSIAVLMLQTPADNPRTLKRMEITRGLFERKTSAIAEVMAQGTTRAEHLFYLVHLGDWLSLLVAEKANVNPVSIDSINFLKNELSKIS
jgi:glucose/mannose-6-phosphate isomerase